MPTYSYRCERCGCVMHWLCAMADRDKPGPLCTAVCAAEGVIARTKRTLDAPAVSSSFPGSHRDEYTKTGPRK